MFEWVTEFLVSVFGQANWLAVMIVSALPMLEFHTAIPFGMSAEIWGANAMSPFAAFFWGYLGSCVIMPVILLIGLPIMNRLRNTRLFRKAVDEFDKKLRKSKTKIEGKAAERAGKKHNPAMIDFYKIIGVVLFVALPLPFSGIYAGCLVALILGLGFWKSLLALLAGNLITGIFMVAVCTVFQDFVTYMLGAFFVGVFAALLFALIKVIVKPKALNT
ncbi:MAG: small multi-drug export protein [Firmicutes bacterium]|nr:small multi-drug export protein [Bacillota bacterium]